MPSCSLHFKLGAVSMKIIKGNQAESGAFVASPTFNHYKYSWLRDGTFIAYALDLYGDYEAAEGFYQWVSNTIIKHKDKIIKGKEMDTRFTTDGEIVNEEWGNYQLDGYGTWLWGLNEHIKLTNFSMENYKESVDLTLRYLKDRWNDSNYDCWEENREYRHPATLAAIYVGFKAFDFELAERVKQVIMEEGVIDGHFTKHIGVNEIDSSLLWISTPFRVVEPNHPVMVDTVKLIEQKLVSDHGVHRYPTDEYYGGGQWILLSAWLGWYYVEIGEIERAKKQLKWIEKQMDKEGHLPEQVQHHLLIPDKWDEWVNNWGNPAHPLLWSHAMYLILKLKLEKA